MPPKSAGRPRLPEADAKKQKKRDYQRNYQEQRKTQIATLTTEIKKCEDDLKAMKAKRKELRDMAKSKLDAKMVDVEFDPDEYAKGGMSYAKSVMKPKKTYTYTDDDWFSPYLRKDAGNQLSAVAKRALAQRK